MQALVTFNVSVTSLDFLSKNPESFAKKTLAPLLMMTVKPELDYIFKGQTIDLKIKVGKSYSGVAVTGDHMFELLFDCSFVAVLPDNVSSTEELEFVIEASLNDVAHDMRIELVDQTDDDSWFVSIHDADVAPLGLGTAN